MIFIFFTLKTAAVLSGILGFGEARNHFFVSKKSVTAPSGIYPSYTSCGIRNRGTNVLTTRILNGVNSSENELPWRCIIQIFYMNQQRNCGCTIIDNSWVITAAHCTHGLRIDNLFILSGTSNFTNLSMDNFSFVKRIVEHPSYVNNEINPQNDIALLELRNPLKWTQKVSPVCLPWRLEGQDCQRRIKVLASGWGRTSFNGSGSQVLQKVELPCMQLINCKYYYGRLVTDNNICTYAPGKDICKGDSGGSIDYEDPKTGRYFALGVVSWNANICGKVNYPAVHTKITKYLTWIKETATGAKFFKI